MTKKKIIKKVLQYDWGLWADRPFHAFFLSFFKIGQTRKELRKLGVNAQLPTQLFQNHGFLKSPMVWDKFAGELEMYLKKGGSVFRIVRETELFYKKYKPVIVGISRSKQNTTILFKQAEEVLSLISGYTWITHGLEHVYSKRLRKEIPKYYQGDVEKYIGDVSFPVKKNSHVYFEKALRSTTPLLDIKKNYAWIKVRDGFNAGFTLAELAALRRQLKKSPQRHHIRPKVHPRLKTLVQIAQELVYYRTYRTDVLHEFLYILRPLFKKIAKINRIPFGELKFYDAQSVVSGMPLNFGQNPTFISYESHAGFFLKKPLVSNLYKKTSVVRGTPAYFGKVIGIAKIVPSAAYIEKVKKGDILIAPTTAPSFITGMAKAAAFVTDEGGITSHSAIVSREMKKPCIIGTKIATKVFKDGDRVEVDAYKGTVKKV